MWQILNEPNYYYAGADYMSDAKLAAAAIKAADPTRPVAIAWGELPSSETFAALHAVDVWGLNVYRGGSSFGDLHRPNLIPVRPARPHHGTSPMPPCPRLRRPHPMPIPSKTSTISTHRTPTQPQPNPDPNLNPTPPLPLAPTDLRIPLKCVPTSHPLR